MRKDAPHEIKSCGPARNPVISNLDPGPSDEQGRGLTGRRRLRTTAQALKQRQYLREWRARGRRHCECGRAATVKRTGAEGSICERCARLEERRERAEQRRTRNRSRYGYKRGGLPEHELKIGEQV